MFLHDIVTPALRKILGLDQPLKPAGHGRIKHASPVRNRKALARRRAKNKVARRSSRLNRK